VRILVADDTGALAATALVFLSYWGHDVQVACDGVEALRKARAWRPELVLARVNLERMGGLCLMSALRAGGSLAGTEFVLVGPREERHRAQVLGAAAFLEAPLAVPELARAVARVAALREARAGQASGPGRRAASRR
jgi:CheY-like chemotaxis protein